MAGPSNPYMPTGLDRLSTMLMALGAGVSGAESRGQSGWAGIGPAAAMYGQANQQANQQAMQYGMWQQQQEEQKAYRQAQEENLRSQITQREAESKAKLGMTQGVMGALGGGGGPPGFGQYSPPPTMGPGGDILSQARAAVKGNESGGRYDIIHPVANAKGQRAYGAYGVMDFNIGPWTQEVLGKPMTPQEFLANPQAQDAVFDAKFGAAMKQYGNPQDAASVWFSGKPLAGNNAGPDVLGTTVAGYVNKFNRGMGGGGGAARPSCPRATRQAAVPAAWPNHSLTPRPCR
jgi:hypothetical protein